MENKTAQVAYTGIIMALVVFVFYVGKPILTPLILAILLAFLLMPTIAWMNHRKVPLYMTSVILILLIMAVVLFFGYLLSVSFDNFNKDWPGIQKELSEVVQTFILSLKSRGLQVDYPQLLQSLNLQSLSSYVGKGMQSMVGIVSNLVIIFFVTLFLVIEAKRFEEKSIHIYGEENPLVNSFTQIARQIQRYILWKTIISFATGVIVYFILLAFNIKFAMLWGILTFVLNYIPTVGSILATLPPVLLALLQYSPVVAFLLLGTLVLLQSVIGNFIEPRIMGKELNLSPLVVFVNMILWGFLWGGVGMILSTPLLVAIKVIVSHSSNFAKVMRLLEN